MSEPVRQLNAALRDSPDAPRRSGATIGRVVAIDANGEVRVDFEGNPSGPLVARRIGVIDDVDLRQATSDDTGAVLVFEDGDPARPLILSLCPAQTQPVPARDPIQDQLDEQAGQIELRIDGRRIVLEGSERVELRCGDAAIELRADGTIKLRGRDIKSLARRRQRIAGGSVDIN